MLIVSRNKCSTDEHRNCITRNNNLIIKRFEVETLTWCFKPAPASPKSFPIRQRDMNLNQNDLKEFHLKRHLKKINFLLSAERERGKKLASRCRHQLLNTRCDVMLNFIKMGLTFVQRSLVMICSNLTNCSGEGETQKMRKKNLH